MHGMSNPPLAWSAEYLLWPVTLQTIKPPLCKNMEQTWEIVLGTWPTVTPSFLIATAKVSWQLLGSLAAGSCSSIGAAQILWYTWYPLTTVLIWNNESRNDNMTRKFLLNEYGAKSCNIRKFKCALIRILKGRSTFVKILLVNFLAICQNFPPSEFYAVW